MEPRLLVAGVPCVMKNETLIKAVEKNVAVAKVRDLGDVKIIKRFGKRGEGENAVESVVLEVPPGVKSFMLHEGRLYVDFYSFRVREYVDVLQCFGCGSFGHAIKSCSMAGRLCHNCGEEGHVAAVCVNPVRCRNCDRRGLEAGHRVTSMACPVLQFECERMKTRVVA